MAHEFNNRELAIDLAYVSVFPSNTLGDTTVFANIVTPIGKPREGYITIARYQYFGNLFIGYETLQEAIFNSHYKKIDNDLADDLKLAATVINRLRKKTDSEKSIDMSCIWKFIIGDEKCGGIIFAANKNDARVALKKEYGDRYSNRELKEAEIYPLTEDDHYSNTGIYEAYCW